MHNNEIERRKKTCKILGASCKKLVKMDLQLELLRLKKAKKRKKEKRIKVLQLFLKTKVKQLLWLHFTETVCRINWHEQCIEEV